MMRIAIQGELGAFSEIAAESLSGGRHQVVPTRSFRAVVEAVETGSVDAGVLPVENRTVGPVVDSLTALSAGTAVEIDGECIVPVRLHLMGLDGARVGRLARVASHPVALAQCQRFLSQYPGWTVEAYYDSAGAARDVAAGGESSFAAIAGVAAATRYKLAILAHDVHDLPGNATRFVLIRRRP
ncbi:MAG: prephenate dehydratase domain-containing protein [Gemmatimonadales bacterium]